MCGGSDINPIVLDARFETSKAHIGHTTCADGRNASFGEYIASKCKLRMKVNGSQKRPEMIVSWTSGLHCDRYRKDGTLVVMIMHWPISFVSSGSRKSASRVTPVSIAPSPLFSHRVTHKIRKVDKNLQQSLGRCIDSLESRATHHVIHK